MECPKDEGRSYDLADESELDSRCVDKDGDPCGKYEKCNGRPYGWEHCIYSLNKTTAQVREEFERDAKRSLFPVKRNDFGEYEGTTFFLWAGYWLCAVENNVLVGDCANAENMNRL